MKVRSATRSGLVGLLAIGILGVFLPLVPAGPAGAAVATDNISIAVGGSPLGSIALTPGTLTPAFSVATSDYVVHCQTGINAMNLQLTAAPGGTIQVGSEVGPSLALPLRLVENQAVALLAPGGQQYWIRCLPHDFPALEVHRLRPSTPGWYLTGNAFVGTGEAPYAMILDSNGTPVWYQRAPGSAINVEPAPSNTVAWAPALGPGFGVGPNTGYQVHQLDASGVQYLTTVGMPTDLHELLFLPNGDHIMLSYPLVSGVDLSAFGLGTNQTIADCAIQELDPNGNLVWQWRAYSDNHVDIHESLTQPAHTVGLITVYDPFHCNSVDVSPTGDVLVSARHMSSVLLINHSGTNAGVAKDGIVWKLGGTPTNKDGAKVLQILNDPESTISGQHDARFQPNGDVSLYDDQTFTMGQARGVEYHVDLQQGTASLVWEYEAPPTPNTPHFAGATGSFRRYPDGDSLIGWGFMSGADFGLQGNAGFTEVDASGNLLWQLSFPAGDELYRAIKVPITTFGLNVLRQTAGLPRDSQYTGAIEQHWWGLGGPSSPDGMSVSPQSFTPEANGQFEHFQFGSIYWSPLTGAWEVHGAIRNHWAGLRWEASALGYPLTDETPTLDGQARFNNFQSGSIYWTPTTGAWEVHGAIGAHWAALPSNTGVLGYPVTDETGTPDGIGRFNHFQSGSIYWTPTTGAWEVHGAIQAHWAALRWEASAVGYPKTDETGTSDGVGRYNDFQFGSIYFTPQTGAWEVHGSIWVHWAGLGREKSPEGYPMTDETSTLDGQARFNTFQNGSIYWTPTTGAWEVHGAIGAHWAALPSNTGVLGYPTSDEMATPDGLGRFNTFQNGNIYWSPGTGAFEVHGPILQAYLGVQATQSHLGYPTSDVFPTLIGLRSTFQGGYIDWNAFTNQVTISST